MWSRFMMSQVKHNSYFIVGMAAGLWLALALVPLEESGCSPAAPLAAPLVADDEFEPHREDKPLGSGGAPAGRTVQRPRYYSTELGMRGSLLTGVLSSEEALSVQVPALNRTLARLQPALKFFITASAMSAVPGLANVVGFTDTREMLKPFHALKYLADNYLEEYDFFFLVTDAAFVNTRRLTELVARLSVSRDVYMGEPAPDSQYCELDAGVLLSASVLRAVHAELEWCVRNSYSPRHHENLGRCVLHAAHTPCAAALQGQHYRALRLRPGARPAVAELDAAVAARPAAAADLPALHALAARARLQAGEAEAARLRAALRRAAPRHPPGYRNHTWPAGLRADPGLAPAPPADRFSHLRWTLFNATHAYMPDELRAAAPHSAAHAAALRLVLRAAAACARRAWPGAEPALLEGARLWEPAAGLRYRLLLRTAAGLRALEAVRPLGAARLVPVRYVTESARVHVLLCVAGAAAAAEARGFLARYERVALQQDRNTQLTVLWAAANDTLDAALERDVRALAARHAGAALRLEPVPAGAAPADWPEAARGAAAAAAGLRLLSPRLPRDALLLVAPPHLQFNQDFLNRVRMNTIPGVSWFLPLPFSRHAQFAHPGFHSSSGTGRFSPAPRAPLYALYNSDYDAAMRADPAGAASGVEEVLARSALRCVRAPEPGAVLEPRPAPCTGPGRRACLRALQDDHFRTLDLGTRSALAQLLLETEAA